VGQGGGRLPYTVPEPQVKIRDPCGRDVKIASINTNIRNVEATSDADRAAGST
jgi:hypothetical protein